MNDPYNHDDDDDQPTLQRVAPTSNKMACAAPVDAYRESRAFPDEPATSPDHAPLHVGPIVDARSFVDIDTEKMPVEVAAGLRRASQVD